MSTYLDDAVNNLAEGLRLLQDTESVLVARSVQKFLMPLPTVYPFIVIMPGGAIGVSENAGDDYDGQTFTAVLRYIIGGVKEDIDGDLQARLWLYMPLIMNYVNAHADLVFTAEQSHIPELHPDGAWCSQLTRLGRFRDDPDHIGMEFAVSIPFHVEVERVIYPDLEE